MPSMMFATMVRLIAFPAEVSQAEAAIKAFLKQRMYRHPRVMRVMGMRSRFCSTCSIAIKIIRPICLRNGCPAVTQRDRNRAGRGGSATSSPDDGSICHDRASEAFLTRPRICR